MLGNPSLRSSTLQLFPGCHIETGQERRVKCKRDCPLPRLATKKRAVAGNDEQNSVVFLGAFSKLN